jgi:hypothetical protein
MPINITGPSKDQDGAPQTPQQLGVAPAQVISTLDGKQQIEALQRRLEGCADCKFFHFPQPGSRDRAEVVAYVVSLFASLPPFQRNTVPGRNPAEWGVCEGSPSGLRICAYFINHCEHFRKG